jgi:L-lysine exporter family protein LysE/ArgO
VTEAALHGFILALGLILPLGVQNTFVFTQGAVQPRWVRALPVVLTAALCDTLLIILAVSGVSLVVLQVSWFKAVLSWVGVGFLAYMGWVTWKSEAGGDGPALEAADWPVRRQVLFSASVSLLNPHAILDTVGVIGTNSLQFSDTAARLAYTLSCIAVSWFWFFGLMTAGHLLGAASRNGPWRRWLSKASALIMWAVGIQLITNLIRG